MLAPFDKIVIDRYEEAKMRRQMIRKFPMENIMAIWGYIRKNTLYVCAFMPIEHNVGERGQPLKAYPNKLRYNEEEFDHNEDEANAENLIWLGTIHSHPKRDHGFFSEGDLWSSQDTQESVVGVCAIDKNENGRHKCVVVYWPAIRPLTTVLTEKR